MYIAGKYTSLDFETAEPINALDCLLTKTKYGPEVVVGKSFTMSWVREWEKWLAFDTGRTDPSQPSSAPTRTNRECTSALGGGVFLGVAMIRPLASWQENPLSMVNYYAWRWFPPTTEAMGVPEW